PVCEIDCVSNKDKYELLEELSGEVVDYGEGNTLVALFKRCATEMNNSVALVDDNNKMTYGEVDELSERLSFYLRRHFNIGRGDVVGVMMERSALAVTMILGILKAGAAWMPLDVSYPRSRKKYMLENVGARLLITESSWLFDLDY